MSCFVHKYLDHFELESNEIIDVQKAGFRLKQNKMCFLVKWSSFCITDIFWFDLFKKGCPVGYKGGHLRVQS